MKKKTKYQEARERAHDLWLKEHPNPPNLQTAEFKIVGTRPLVVNKFFTRDRNGTAD